jgi:putative DNA primase/helicase
VQFRLTCKLTILTNHPPKFDVTDQGLRRRCVVVPWDAKFRTGENRIMEMEEQLLPELEGILVWMLEGLRQYDRIGLDPSTCKAVQRATDEYLEERNPLQGAIEAGYVELDEDARDTPGALLRQTLTDYYDDHPAVPKLADDELSDALEALGCFRRKTNKGAMWSGVKVRGAAV